MAETPIAVSYGLGIFGDPPSVDIFIDLDEAEFAVLEAAVSAISALKAPFTFQLVERNYLELRSIHEFAAILLSLGRQFGPADPRLLTEAVATSIVNWLTATRLFLDHEETALKQRYGHKSEEAERFKAATARAFDGHGGYRFTYKFRNYVQHCGFPIMNVMISENPSGGLLKQRAEFLLVRDELLNRYEEWGPVRKDLEAMEATFGLLELVDDAMTALRLVYRHVLDARVEKATEKVRPLLSAVDRIRAVKSEGAPALYRFSGDPRSSLQVTPWLLPVEAIESLERVRTGEAEPSSLFADRDVASARPRIDPASVRERFHRDNRGVQVLTTYLAEGGATPRASTRS